MARPITLDWVKFSRPTLLSLAMYILRRFLLVSMQDAIDE
jgi:hypothetical protein